MVTESKYYSLLSAFKKTHLTQHNRYYFTFSTSLLGVPIGAYRPKSQLPFIASCTLVRQDLQVNLLNISSCCLYKSLFLSIIIPSCDFSQKLHLILFNPSGSIS